MVTAAAGAVVLAGVITVSFGLGGAGKEAAAAGMTPAQTKERLTAEFSDFFEPLVEPRGVTEITLTASASTVELMDGVQTEVWSYNGTVPGPQIRVPFGNMLRINFENQLPQETTIHFHGIRVPNAFDGVPGVTQPPVPPGGTFTYEFTPKDSGTYWYHPHVNASEQVERGLYGTIVVEDPAVGPRYTDDMVWVIDDWLLTEAGQVYSRFVTQRDLAHDGRWGNVVTVNGKQRPKFTVQPGARVRVRLVNSSNGRVYRLYFAGLTATAIAVDGLYVRDPFPTYGFDLAPGNRLDVDITIPADAAPGREYPLQDHFGRGIGELGTIVVAGEAVPTPQFDYPSNDSVPEWAGAAGLSPDVQVLQNAQRATHAGRGPHGHGPHNIEWTLNGKTYSDYDPITLTYNTFNKVRYINQSARLHPMHLHGQFFKVLSRNGTPVDEGFFRDTVLIYGREEIEIGIVPVDRGRWAHHCHILEHADAGMMGIVDVL